MAASHPMQVPAPELHPDVERFAVWLAGSADGGARLVEQARPSGDVPSQLRALLRTLPRDATRTDLDAVLRVDPTTVMDLQHPLIRGEPRRLYVLQRQLQRTCLAATLGRLARDRRAAFILVDLLGYSKEAAAAILQRTASAVDVLVCRARRELDNYLGPRCEHVDPENPCHCVNRLPSAVDRGFVAWPARNDLPDDGPLQARRYSDASALYASLTPPG
ncbi:RNA polymerase sigma factor [Nannocystis punicea]|uniref:Sigma factor-like helix-turn-helix DNA-binding protein n=1 Tax=Nannocystis punicea TaxID=2995304 RepID=A0ABY7HC06_9BACT|nr:sigma factor-like helix-turn-helix DNA-binding protein [Nannocystis poenicansa]WAS96534.1 sigma factor-like helix-turn-helix DNA-binding protein [Nannocystis poenicansa]